MYYSAYETLKGLCYLQDSVEQNEGYCKNGHFNIIPACAKIGAGNKIFCDSCGTIIFEVIKIKVVESQLMENEIA